MRALLKALMKEGMVSVVLLVILCLLVWFGGAYLDFDDKTRIGVICLLLALWAAMFVAQKVMSVRSAVRIEQQLKAQSGAQLAGASADKKAEVEALRKKFEESIEALKKSKGGKSALFTLPWYVIIGPPGSGKTTALQESGLNFPASQGNAKVKGIGGTRNCDWWFTDEGILLDTAGRYTTVAEDQHEWFAFLGMIKQGRKQKPINGAIVAIGMDELLQGTQTDIDRIAKDVRNRLDELSARLQAVFPVYVMFTKCDLLPGFAEFFEDFTKEERSQVWGFSMPYAVPDRQYAEIFDEETRRLSDQLAPRALKLLSSERPAAKKQQIYLFPQQFKLARTRMREFVESLFHATAFQESAVLRGIYFSSGTQKGAPIDQIMSRIGAAAGLETSSSDDRVEKKSYFIHDLFTRIIFPDKTLARSSSAVLRKRRAARLALHIAALVALALAAFSLVGSFVANRGLVQDTRASAQAVAALDAGATRLERLRALDQLRLQLEPLEVASREGHPISQGLGMYQGNKLFVAALKPWLAEVRRDYLEDTRRRIFDELTQMLARTGTDRSQAVYQEMLDLWRVYRMLGGDLEPQPALVAAVLKKERRWSGPVTGDNAHEVEEKSGEILEFYAALLPRAFQDRENWPLLIDVDQTLVSRIGEVLKTAFWADVAYNAIVQLASERVSPLNLSVLLSGDGNAHMLEVRPPTGGEDPQRHLNAYTQDAWDREIQRLIEERAGELAKTFAEFQLARSADDLRKSLIDRHRAQHNQRWSEFLTAIHPSRQGFGSVEDARNTMRQLVGDNSPYRLLFTRAWERRALSMGAGDRVGEATERETKALHESLLALKELVDELDQFASGTSKGNRFKSYLATPDRLNNLQKALNHAALKVRNAFPTDAAASADVMMRVVDSVVNCLRVEAVAEVEELWRNDVLQRWTATCAGKFPFKLDAEQSATLTHMADLFNPFNGRIWQAHSLFAALEALKFNERSLFVYRAEFVDTIREATRIRDALFDTPQDDRVKVRFAFTLILRGRMTDCSFQTGSLPNGQANKLNWNDNEFRSRDFVWEHVESTQARPGALLTASWGQPPNQRTAEEDFLADEWGLLRLFTKGGITGPVGGSDGREYLCNWTFVAPDNQVYRLNGEVRAAKPVNPFAPGFFTSLRMSGNVAQESGR